MNTYTSFTAGRSCLCFYGIFFLLIIVGFLSCSEPRSKNLFSSDTTVISKGKLLFEQNCASCHHFNSNGIGPDLSGITQKVSTGWMMQFIKDPAALITAKDQRADSLFHQYKSTMPSFAQLGDSDINALLAFIHTQQPVVAKKSEPRKGILDPYPTHIPTSGLVIDLQQIIQFPTTAVGGAMPKTRITKLDFEPGTNILFVNDLRGVLYKLKDTVPREYINIRNYFPHFIDVPGLGTGLGSFAFHPSFSSNGLLYTTHTETAGSDKADFTYNDSIPVKLQWVLTEWKAENNNTDSFTGTHRELLRVNMVSEIHGVQEICFNPLTPKGDKDYGLLYIGIGDGGAVQSGYPALALDRDKIWGAVIRINPTGNNSHNKKYGIPADNPFATITHKKILPEIYADGFRNPHRTTWTRSGMMLVSNIGQTNIESINLVKPGANFGWPIREGSFVLDPYHNLDNIFPLTANDSSFHITYPVVAYDHDEGNAITGGYEYEGKKLTALKGKFLFGDITSGRLFQIQTNDIKQGALAPISEWKIRINGREQSLKEACGNNRVDLRFGRDAAGEMYVMTKADGRLYKIQAAHQN